MLVFPSVLAAIHAGFEIERPAIPDSDGNLRARIMTGGGWQRALVRMAR